MVTLLPIDILYCFQKLLNGENVMKWNQIGHNTFSMMVPGGVLYRYSDTAICFVPHAVRQDGCGYYGGTAGYGYSSGPNRSYGLPPGGAGGPGSPGDFR